LVIGDKVECDIKKRGVHPLGNGQVKFRCPIITFLNYFDWIDEGKIKRIRGNAFTSRIPGSFCTRMVDACRGVFNNFLPDVWIAVDNVKSKNTEEM
jgi:RNA 3'-terminal phosphate cyclase-like protein